MAYDSSNFWSFQQTAPYPYYRNWKLQRILKELLVQIFILWKLMWDLIVFISINGDIGLQNLYFLLKGACATRDQNPIATRSQIQWNPWSWSIASHGFVFPDPSPVDFCEAAIWINIYLRAFSVKGIIVNWATYRFMVTDSPRGLDLSSLIKMPEPRFPAAIYISSHFFFRARDFFIDS